MKFKKRYRERGRDPKMMTIGSCKIGGKNSMDATKNRKGSRQ